MLGAVFAYWKEKKRSPRRIIVLEDFQVYRIAIVRLRLAEAVAPHNEQCLVCSS